MEVLVSGSTGLVGSALVPALRDRGDRVRVLHRIRSGAGADRVFWDPARAEIDAGGLEGLDAVVHLAGENIAAGRWTKERKRRIAESRIEGTRLLARTLAACTRPPRVLVCASAIGFYGSRGDEVLDEKSPPGTGFLAEVCQEWERAADPAREAGLRVAHLRIGLVLSSEGGALPRMLPPFKLGVGGRLGSGRQWMSWIAIGDLVRAIVHALDRADLAGAVNAVAPEPVTNADFTRALGQALRRPTVFPMPAPAVRLLFGEMGEALLLGSTRVVPARLEQQGFAFEHRSIGPALRALVGRKD